MNEPPSLLERIQAGQEEAISVETAAKLPTLSRDGRPANRQVIYRMMTRGVRGVRLERMSTAGGIVTTREAVGRFLAELNDPDRHATPVPPGPTARRSSAAARRAHEAATDRMRRAGLAVG